MTKDAESTQGKRKREVVQGPISVASALRQRYKSPLAAIVAFSLMGGGVMVLDKVPGGFHVPLNIFGQEDVTPPQDPCSIADVTAVDRRQVLALRHGDPAKDLFKTMEVAIVRDKGSKQHTGTSILLIRWNETPPDDTAIVIHPTKNGDDVVFGMATLPLDRKPIKDEVTVLKGLPIESGMKVYAGIGSLVRRDTKPRGDYKEAASGRYFKAFDDPNYKMIVDFDKSLNVKKPGSELPRNPQSICGPNEYGPSF